MRPGAPQNNAPAPPPSNTPVPIDNSGARAFTWQSAGWEKVDLPPPVVFDPEHGAPAVLDAYATDPSAVPLEACMIGPQQPTVHIIEPIEVDHFWFFSNYAVQHFAQRRGSKKQELAQWAKTLKAPLLARLDNGGQSAKFAQEVAQAIAGYMSGKTPDLAVAQLVLKRGLASEDLRDEIYCQLCKQLTNNPSLDSTLMGWELLSFCASTFAPSEEFVKYLAAYIMSLINQYRKFPSQAAKNPGVLENCTFALRALRRTVENGNGTTVPSGVSLMGIIHKRYSAVRIKVMDGRELGFYIDSASTAGEARAAVQTRLGLADAAGYSLFAVYGTIACKVPDRYRLVDALAKYGFLRRAHEAQYPKKEQLGFSFVFKRSCFVPLRTEFPDAVDLDLTFTQAWEEYLAVERPSEKQAAELAALKVQVDASDYPKEPASFVKCIPRKLLAESHQSRAVWRDRVRQYHSKLVGVTPVAAKHKFIASAAAHPLYGALLFSGSLELPSTFLGLSPGQFGFAVNHLGVHTLTRTNELIKTFPFTALAAWTADELMNTVTLKFTSSGDGAAAQSRSRTLSVSGRHGAVSKQVTFVSASAGRIVAAIDEHVAALRKCTEFFRAVRDHRGQAAGMLPFESGDLIRVRDRSGRWWTGECNGRVGQFPADYATPYNVSASDEEDSFLRGDDSSAKAARWENRAHSLVAAKANLEVGDQRNRALSNRRLSAASMIPVVPVPVDLEAIPNLRKKRSKGAAMTFSSDPIKETLLDLPSAMNRPAKAAFLATMKYMGDYPSKGTAEFKLVQDLVQIGLDAPGLHDELFVQLFRQLTGNPRRESLVKGWELMTVLCSCFQASTSMEIVLKAFLLYESLASPDPQVRPFAQVCLDRVKDVGTSGPRKCPPCEAEVASVQQLQRMIFLVYLLDGSNKGVYVSSNTTVKQVNADMNTKLGLPESMGFSLFQQEADQDVPAMPAMPLPGDDYICDHLAVWEKLSGGGPNPYSFLFKQRIPSKSDDEAKLARTNPFAFDLLYFQISEDIRKLRLPVPAEIWPEAQALQVLAEGTGSGTASMDAGAIADARMKLVQLAKTTPLYGKWVFEVKVAGGSLAWLVIGTEGIGVHDRYAPKPRDFWPHHQVLSYDSAARDEFHFLSGSMMRPIKHSFVGYELIFAIGVVDAYRLMAQAAESRPSSRPVSKNFSAKDMKRSVSHKTMRP